MKTFTTVTRYDETSRKLELELANRLTAAGYTRNDDDPRTVFVIGGDGTYLYAVHKYIDLLDKVEFFGIHTGTLGFFTDYVDTEFDEFVNDFLTKDHEVIESQLLQVSVDRNTKYYALNEMRVENIVRTQEIEVLVNELEFETYRGTGVCVCTQLGSTAYNRSLNGAVLQEGLPLIEMTEIAGIHHKKYRSLGAPIVMKEDSKIIFLSRDYSDAVLCIDAKTYPLDGSQRVTVELCDKKVKTIRLKNIHYFKRLQSLF